MITALLLGPTILGAGFFLALSLNAEEYQKDIEDFLALLDCYTGDTCD